jgi:hypothetical protein
MYPKFLDFNVRIASAVWFTLVTWIPSTFSFVQVILFRVRDSGRTVILSETKLWMSDTELRMLSLRLVGYTCITVVIHGSVEDQWIVWRHTHSACVTFCWKNVNAHTNFISSIMFLGIENYCRCSAVGLWYSNWHFLPFLCFSVFSNLVFLFFLCLFIVSFPYFFSVCFYVFIFNFHIFRFLPLSFISSIFPSFF